MHDLVLLRCTHCRETTRLAVYEQSHVYVAPGVAGSQELADWLAEHLAHHPPIAAHAFDLDSDPGIEAVTWSRLQDERDAADRAGLDAI